MVGIRLSEEMEKRLQHIAQATGRTKSFYVKEALNEYLEDIEDRYIGLYRLENPEKYISMKEAEEEFDLES